MTDLSIAFGVIALLLLATLIYVTNLKARTERDLRREQADLQTKLTEATKSEGRVEELAKTVVRIGDEKTDLAKSIDELQRQLTTAEGFLAEARTQAENAKTNAKEQVELEREAGKRLVEAKDEQIEALNAFIDNAKEVLGDQFKAISADTLRVVSKELQKSAAKDARVERVRIEGILQPVKETLKSLDKQVKDTNQERSNAEALLDERIGRLAHASESLTNALKKPVVRGGWGEMTLENALEDAGLQADTDYVLQHTTDAEDGRQRTDAVVKMPKGRRLVIDSKNLMESYLAMSKEEDPEKKQILADAHSKSFRKHMRSLGEKKYWERYDGVDFIVLFLPHDGMYHAAVKDEADLVREMNQRRVFVANPVILTPLLLAIRCVLDQERLNKSAVDISRIGSDLYTTIASYAKNVASLGRNLRLTVKAYNDSIPGLDRFIVAKGRSLKKLGAGRGEEPSLPDVIELQLKPFGSDELRPLNAIIQGELEEPIPSLPDRGASPAAE